VKFATVVILTGWLLRASQKDLLCAARIRVSYHLFLEQSLNLLYRSVLSIEYLSYVRGWYSFLAKQMDGLYFKDGGPVTLVQVYLYFAMHPRAEG